MTGLRFFILPALVFAFGCDTAPAIHKAVPCQNTSVTRAKDADGKLALKQALVSTRFQSFPQLKTVMGIDFTHGYLNPQVLRYGPAWVQLTHCSEGSHVSSVLDTGVSENDFTAARDGGFWDRLLLILRSPYAVAHRREMQRILILARRREDLFGEGDPAFYDISEKVMANIRSTDAATLDSIDLHSEKGYFNTVNHITAQAFITSVYSEKLADFMADAHERKTLPQLVSGTFTQAQLTDIGNGPVDNYIDIINNEWGQELGKKLKAKYHITEDTYWTPSLLTNYLNDVQAYYSWAFQIGFNPFRPDDEVILKFTYKLNEVMQGRAI